MPKKRSAEELDTSTRVWKALKVEGRNVHDKERTDMQVVGEGDVSGDVHKAAQGDVRNNVRGETNVHKDVRKIEKGDAHGDACEESNVSGDACE